MILLISKGSYFFLRARESRTFPHISSTYNILVKRNISCNIHIVFLFFKGKIFFNSISNELEIFSNE